MKASILASIVLGCSVGLAAPLPNNNDIFTAGSISERNQVPRTNIKDLTGGAAGGAKKNASPDRRTIQVVKREQGAADAANARLDKEFFSGKKREQGAADAANARLDKEFFSGKKREQGAADAANARLDKEFFSGKKREQGVADAASAASIPDKRSASATKREGEAVDVADARKNEDSGSAMKSEEGVVASRENDAARSATKRQGPLEFHDISNPAAAAGQKRAHKVPAKQANGQLQSLDIVGFGSPR
ncbi:hypothetical protein P170DRAFT_425517 [Aspergillus steynii IBT 23096]|uniref:Uncharacterized protein n=1 Tax=Aspergillus steynii IBT 23096 TaxID=1392250 RepID=A0A2I2GEH5_9EURO|nr:uncharacterized protein P170DRAFT_425517 [Aspergillus steynii IBT 23096]PLB51270.1 hypothetical protein P170DRAFT_425517 [Aspergillus steynii IBT 23096]